jgi:capsular polysaccharide biosynthesis protein
MEGPVILVQDYGDGSNFAHFAFDWLPRIMYAIETGIADPSRSTFVMGGRKVPFQVLLLETLFPIYGLDWGNFLFPERRITLELKNSFTFFSDQRLIPLHPAQMAAPRSVELILTVCNRVAAPIEHPNAERIFISREDARFRRILNESELAAIAVRSGYKIVRMSDYDIRQQIGLMRGARHIVGAHGMGLTQLVFNRGPVRILELFHPSLGTDAYMMMSRALGMNYQWMIGEAIEDNKASYRIDPEHFARRLRELDG